MDSRKADSEELYKMITKASFGETQILGGSSGLHGMSRGVREDLMKQTGVICGKMRSDNLLKEEIEQYLALCNTAVATNVLSDSDFEKIVNLIEDRADG